MSIGCLLIDIGATITSVSIYDNNSFIFTGTIPLGGWHISSDIAQCFGLTFNHAERIKIIHGNVIATTLDEHKSFDLNELKDLDEENTERNFIKAKELSQVIKPRAEELFEMVLHLLKKHNMWQHRHKRIILTGGSSQLQGMKDLAGYMLGGGVRLANAQSINAIPIQGMPEEYKSPAFASAMGMLRIANNQRIKASLLAANNKNNSIFSKLLKWF
jgi:cell division protein FtsA